MDAIYRYWMSCTSHTARQWANQKIDKFGAANSWETQFPFHLGLWKNCKHPWRSYDGGTFSYFQSPTSPYVFGGHSVWNLLVYCSFQEKVQSPNDVEVFEPSPRTLKDPRLNFMGSKWWLWFQSLDLSLFLFLHLLTYHLGANRWCLLGSDLSVCSPSRCVPYCLPLGFLGAQ